MEKSDYLKRLERDLIKKDRSALWSPFTKAVRDYSLINEGDRVAVCISGGKDSFLLAKLIQELQCHGPIDFEAIYLSMDPGYAKRNRELIEKNASLLDIPVTFFSSDIFENVDVIEKNPCYICARMRRGCLYSRAKAMGANKIALGHHFDDAVETFAMSLLFEGRLNCFAPVSYMDRMYVTMIRPLLYVGELRSANMAKALSLPVVTSTCPMDRTSRRREAKDLLDTLSLTYPDLRSRIFGAMQRLPLPGWERAGEKQMNNE